MPDMRDLRDPRDPPTKAGDHASLLAAFSAVAPALEACGHSLTAALSAWLGQAGIKVHSIVARVKDPASLARKLARPDRDYVELWDLTDLLGLRVITYFEDDVDRVGAMIEAQLPIDLARSTDKRRREPGLFGYRSLHYVVELDARLPAPARAEIQVRSVLEHAWAEIEHDLGYKAPGAVPLPVRQRLSRLAGLLEIADREFVSIRDELIAYEAALPAQIADRTRDVVLDELALRALIMSGDVERLDLEIAAAHGHPLGPQPFFPDYLLKMLLCAGLTTIAEVQEGLHRHADEIVAMARPYFQFAWATWRLTPIRDERMLRGYAVFFLAHLHVTSGAGLQLDKVERLARLYRELDYQNDPPAAHRVASRLLATLLEAARGKVA
jgi:putative GTP pyrophosphokinase